MNLQFLFGVAFLAGFVLIVMGPRQQRLENGEPHHVIQFGWMAVIIGAFGFLAQFMNFGTVMLLFLLVGFSVIAVDRLFLRKRRGEARAPDSVEYARSFSPIILVVFLVRSFVVEPFQIPSSSMRPGLEPGDFILVNKFAYGLRLPVLNTVFIPVDSPKRGDVMVFELPEMVRRVRHPEAATVNYIKRVVGLPGDVIEYHNRVLFVNGEMMSQEAKGQYQFLDDGNLEHRSAQVSEENLYGHQHAILAFPEKSTDYREHAALFRQVGAVNFPDNCSYDETGFRCVVPPGHYFMMGDNRDGSEDSRFWGFVPEDHIVGRAFFVWLNFHNFKRIGTSVR